LERLAAAKGKRLPVDLGAAHLEQIEQLIAAGYGTTAVAVIRKAIEEAHASLSAESDGERGATAPA
jgi:Arc/MetJ-type ribon-helix-helix transcriptional regulator